ncbi:MAG TPA: redoxin domain-containing protein, partial [Candidatus Omnitrophota bacterium]|nr:redoxin domain-containing protein [Candidatus Omnitrophota bacterium]
MKRWNIFLTVVFMAVACFFPAQGWALEVNQPAPDFVLTDSRGVEHKLSDFKGKYVVLEWTNYDCPFVRKHYDSENMQNLQRTLTADGVIWLSVNSSAPGKQGNFSVEEINQKIDEQKAAPTAYLVDADGKVGQLYGAQTTPHMFVVGPDGNILYQ